jgi:ABC-type dipeptide/oligopeptide/nickel transport system ATPase component
VILITHDLGVVAETADDIVVMYAARIAEHAPGLLAVRAPDASRTPGGFSARYRDSTSSSSG